MVCLATWPIRLQTQENMDVLVRQVTEDTVEAVKLIPQDKLQKCTVEQIVAVPVPRIREETGEVSQLILQGRICDRAME